MILGAELTLLGTQVPSSARNTVEARWQWGRGREEGSRRGIRSMMWVGGPEERIATTTELPPGSSSISTLPFPVPSPWSWEISPVSTPPPPCPPPQAWPQGWGWDGGEASLSCLKDGGAGEAGLGAQTAACVGGDVLRCPPPGSPRSDVCAPPLPARISGSLA